MTDSTQIGDKFLFESAEQTDTENLFSKGKSIAYAIDLNQGGYTSGQVIIDLTNQLSGGSGAASLRDAYIVVPYCVNMQGLVAQTSSANLMSVGYKCGLWNIVDRVQVEMGGKTIITPQNYLNMANNIRAMTDWSYDDVQKWGADSMLYPDDVNSIGFQLGTGTTAGGSATAFNNGDGWYNNTTNIYSTLAPTLYTTAKTGQVTPLVGGNSGFTKRLLANANSSGGNTFGWLSNTAANSAAINSSSGKSTFVPGTNAASASMGTWYTMVKLRLIDLHPIFRELDLSQNPKLKLTLFMNTGTVTMNQGAATTHGVNQMQVGTVSLTQGNTCPVMISSLASSNVNNGIIADTNQATPAASFNVSFGVLTGCANVTAANCGTYFPFTTTRLYVPFYDLIDQSALIERPLKTHHYIDYFTQIYRGQANSYNSNFQLQLSANLKNLRSVCLIPFQNTSGTVTGNIVYGVNNVDTFATLQDSAPWTCCPGASITNFNVMVGNTWLYNNQINYTYQQFIDEFSKFNALNGGLTHYLSNGLIDEYKWSMAQSFYLTDVSRIAQDVPQAVLIQGTNNCNSGLDFVVILGYERSITENRITGEIPEYT